eukprot:1003539-Pyramimonas_sp.AAC.1
MEKLNNSFRPAIHQLFREMQACPRVQCALVIYGHGSDERGAGAKIYERLPSRASAFMRKER